MTKTALTIVLTGILTVAAHFIPGVRWLQAPSIATLERIVDLTPAVGPPPMPTPPPLPLSKPSIPRAAAAVMRIPASIRIPDVPVGPPLSIEDSHEAMNAFYEALARTESLGTKTRILHYGDSPVTADEVTADARAILQNQFGDAGHGFVLIAKPWEWYNHRGVTITSSGWTVEAASQAPRAADGLHGLGGVNFLGTPGASSTVRVAANNGTVEVSFLGMPGGGDFRIDADSHAVLTVATNRPEKISGYAVVPLPSGSQTVTITVTRGTVRLFGMNFETRRGGVIYSSLGLNGASTQHLLRYFDPVHWAGQLARVNPDLLILNYGTNESVYPDYVKTSYTAELREFLARVRAAAPKTSILVMSPADRGERKGGAIVTLPIIPKIIEIQRQLAAENGCAFFDTFHAMGAEGTMARWYENQPRLVNADYTHPLPAGSALIASLLDKALLQGYAGWKEQHQ